MAPEHGRNAALENCNIYREEMGSPGAVAAVAGGAGGAAAGTRFALAAIAKDLDGGQEDGPGDEEDEKDIEPHIRLPPTTSR